MEGKNPILKWTGIVVFFILLSYIIIQFKIAFVLLFLPILIPLYFGFLTKNQVESFLIGMVLMLIFFAINNIFVLKSFFALFTNPPINILINLVTLLIFIVLPGLIGYYSSKREISAVILSSIIWLLYISLLIVAF